MAIIQPLKIRLGGNLFLPGRSFLCFKVGLSALTEFIEIFEQISLTFNHSLMLIFNQEVMI